ncbi:hypothetical protein EDC48_103103 [Gibbsiella quercinecans]|uniref:Uncharacterized protein n=1 Tax=Gibbsiella quercinecans TaxID=929813 RepID=A0A250AWJ1_9GAMM|nr:hypothetical protein [Gibbsiella quercinecans]ATA18330.1 hypothetical protein AWC35_02615 [Gibbsiella quercinecans]RLM05888.1 hypothetical protein BIY27_20625 [Gibbsiella quercinecans]RLM13053.1 hypothetical protein BIY31_01405 [Gibbsiella quercinecans]RLM14461.1 hypothetical protein BIY30_02775 [Gibbsiella quercinecans]TCT90917.1 hypothetical protein EDC48_103103 [Gibbsiella quercinecans]
MYNFSRYQAKELALAYMSGKKHDLSPQEFLRQLKITEKSFDHLLKTGVELPAHEVMVKSF